MERSSLPSPQKPYPLPFTRRSQDRRVSLSPQPKKSSNDPSPSVGLRSLGSTILGRRIHAPSPQVVHLTPAPSLEKITRDPSQPDGLLSFFRITRGRSSIRRSLHPRSFGLHLPSLEVKLLTFVVMTSPEFLASEKGEAFLGLDLWIRNWRENSKWLRILLQTVRNL